MSMGELIEAMFVCGCVVKNGRYSEVCKQDAKRGIKVGQSHV